MIEAVWIGMAVWRISSLLVHEDGPWDVFVRLRKLAGVSSGPDPVEGFLTNLLSCVWCTSLWVAPVMWGLWQVTEWAVIILAASTIAIVAERWNRG